MNRAGKLLLLAAVFGAAYLLTRGSMNLIDKIGKLIHGEEGYRLNVYPDSGGKPTVGKGHLVLATDRVIRNGVPTALHPFGPVKTITPEEAEAFFVKDTEIARNAVANRVTVPLTDNQRAALASLVFNIGVGAFGTSTLLRLLNAGNYQRAADEFLVWKWVTLPNGTREPQLLGRRERERALFLSA